MSYTVAICLPPVPAADAEAWTQVDALIDEEGPVPPVFHELITRLTARYPCICDLPDDQVDDGVWSDGPLRNNAGHKATMLGLVFSQVEEVLPFIIDTANDLGLVVMDGQTEQIHRGGGISGLTLTVEDESPLRAPRLDQIHGVVARMTARGGPGFAILEGPGQDYCQAAGGNGAFCAEWREYAGSGFRHWLAGLPGLPVGKDDVVPTNEDCQVTVKNNEVLAAGDVLAIFTAFAEKKGRPIQFSWRDISERFA